MASTATNATEQWDILGTLTWMWMDLLDAKVVGPRDHFFRLGGNSLKATDLMLRVQRQLGVSVDPVEVFDAPVLEDFAAVLTQMIADAEPGAKRAPDSQFQKIGRTPKALPRLDTGQPRPAPIPLSRAQRHWFDVDSIHVMEQRIPMVRRLRGPLNVAKMEQAFHELKVSHEILRTRYARKDGVLCQEVQRADASPLIVEDLTSLPAAARERRAWETLYAQYRAEVTLDADPVEMRLIRLDSQDHYLAGFVSHLALDATAGDTFWRELFRNYRSATFGTTAANPPRPIQYADFALWENALLTEEQLAKSDAVWRERLRSAQPLQLPNAPDWMSKPSPWGVVPFGLRDAQYADAARFAAQAGVTVPVLLLGALAVVLSRWVGQDRLTLGNVMNGRPPGLADAIGCFAQLRPIYVDVSTDPTFGELMDLARLAYIDASDLRMPPPRSMVTDLQAARFMVNITSNEAQEDNSEKGLGFVVAGKNLSKPLKTEVSRDIDLKLTYGSAALDGWIIYASDRFKWSQINAFAQSLLSFIGKGIQSPASRLSAL